MLQQLKTRGLREEGLGSKESGLTGVNTKVLQQGSGGIGDATNTVRLGERGCEGYRGSPPHRGPPPQFPSLQMLGLSGTLSHGDAHSDAI